MAALTRVRLPTGAQKQVQLLSCPALIAIEGHDARHSPESLTLRDVGVRDLSFLRSVDRLRVLVVSGAAALTDLSGLAAARSLEHLAITYCPAVTDLAPVAGLTRLRSLDLKYSAIRDLRPVLELPDLAMLDLTGCDVDRSVLAGARFQIVGG
jgi:Leucine-rich repeat (LRR) protein